MRRRLSNQGLPQRIALPAPVDDVSERNELQEFVRTALDRLPAEQAEVVVLKIWEEMTFQEIGEVLGESANTAASRYRYAITKLTQSLQPFSEDIVYE
jgi:RNA polymerase sigma-70 factor (ECF subfamily)